MPKAGLGTGRQCRSQSCPPLRGTLQSWSPGKIYPVKPAASLTRAQARFLDPSVSGWSKADRNGAEKSSVQW
eukprot:2647997-Pyramimonas_sp.AAC.1